MTDNINIVRLERDLAAEITQKRIASVIHPSLDIKKFCRSVVLAASKPDSLMLNYDRNSLVNALIQCAQDGLLPDGVDAAILPFYSKGSNANLAKYMPMVDGVIKTLLRDNSIRRLISECVYKNDHFEYEVSTQHFVHRPDWFGERGEIVGCYAMVERVDGTKTFETLNMTQINEIRGCAKQKHVWDKWFSQMCRKSAIHRLSKYVLTDDKAIMQHDKDMYDFNIIQPDNIDMVEDVVDINKQLGLVEE